MKNEFLKTFLFRLGFLFTALFILTLPFHYQLIPEPGRWTKPFAEAMALFTLHRIFALSHSSAHALVSDSVVMYAHVFNLAILSTIIAGIWTFFNRKRDGDSLRYCFRIFMRYYLALQLLIYAFAKIINWQFYAPEPNTLFSRVGDLTPDLLYWTTMGISRPYVIFMGCAELIAALLLFFRRTTLAGALLAFGILTNVLAVNFSFGITVKIFSMFLLLLSILLIAPQAKSLFRFFTGREAHTQTEFIPAWRQGKVLLLLKILIIAGMLAESLWLYTTNPAKEDRNQLHGAYQVIECVNHDGAEGDNVDWRYIFFHSRGYLIAEDAGGYMQDYRYSYDTSGNLLWLELNDSTEIPVSYSGTDSSLNLSLRLESDSLTFFLERINTSRLPLLRSKFHWTNEE